MFPMKIKFLKFLTEIIKGFQFFIILDVRLEKPADVETGFIEVKIDECQIAQDPPLRFFMIVQAEIHETNLRDQPIDHLSYHYALVGFVVPCRLPDYFGDFGDYFLFLHPVFE